ncbi:zinc finger protein OZF [Patella vulgata]|uniref:zinc finger protein OZF n=1 Tax=Patella vulgata TaxID=6465 RepID=UPI0021804211|nr:zinc finger protein OZF [Patella vulgata]
MDVQNDQEYYTCGLCLQIFQDYHELENHSKIHVKTEGTEDQIEIFDPRNIEAHKNAQNVNNADENSGVAIFNSGGERKREGITLNDKSEINMDTRAEGRGRRCRICNEEFNNESELEKHYCTNHFGANWSETLEGKTDKDFSNNLSLDNPTLKAYTNERNDANSQYGCHICNTTFQYKQEIINHLKIHEDKSKPSSQSNEKTLNCELCDKSFKTTAGLNLHVKTHNGDKPIDCDICGKSFKTSVGLNLHIQSHSGEKPIDCEVCGKSFSSKAHLTYHLRTHFGKKSYHCDYCTKAFASNTLLTRHIRTHTGEKPFKCEVCNKSFSENGSLTKHMRIHAVEQPYKCGECNKTFTYKHNLENHLMLHTGHRPYSCETCGKGFRFAGDLTVHIRIHTGEKPFTCDVCSKGFVTKSKLTRHALYHSDNKPFECGECGKKFTEKNNLQKHLMIHTGQKPYQCPTCGKGFRFPGEVKIHAAVHNKDQLEPALENPESSAGLSMEYDSQVEYPIAANIEPSLEESETQAQFQSFTYAEPGLENSGSQ